MTEATEVMKIFDTKLENPSGFSLLSGDASSRRYFRYQEFILTHYPDSNSKSSMERYLYWQKKYTQEHIPVPKLIASDLDRQLVVQEDLGSLMLQNVSGNASLAREKELLDDAVSLLAQIRKISISDYAGTIPSFNLEKLNFEINHTLKYYIDRYLQKSQSIKELQQLWAPVLKKISEMPMVLCHRDYHSRNLMFANSRLFVIDFQDSMLGPIQYDLCSLLDDCYIKYHPANYQSSLRNFFDQALSDKLVSSSFEEFFVNYHLVKLQRQFKAIGSFSYMWSEKNNVKYLKYISYVMESMKFSFHFLELPELASLKEKVLTLYYEH